MSAGKARIPTDDELKRITGRAVAEVVPHDEFVTGLRSGRSLRIKMGFDPTKPVITMGWAVGIRKLRQLQDLGHTVVVIIGDWTARIGDPSGRSETRKMLTEDEVASNADAILEQFFKILDRSRTEVRRQTEWFNDFSLTDVVQLASRFTIAQLLERDDFSNRFSERQPIGIHELLYPLLQGYDSVAIEADIEFGGTDQKFNIHVGRELQRAMGLKCGPVGQGQALLLVPLLIGLDGKRKMSQSFGNFIAIDAAPHDMYGKVMSIPDGLIGDYFELLTDVPDEEIAEVRRVVEDSSSNPMEHKKRLAREIVTQFHSEGAAADADDDFFFKFGAKYPEDIAFTAAPMLDGAVSVELDPSQDRLHSVPKLLVKAGLVSSMREARTLVSQGAVEQIGHATSAGNADFVALKSPRKITSHRATFEDGEVIRVGKHRFLRIVSVD